MVKEELKNKILEKSKNKKISCRAARALARRLRVSHEKMGETLNEMKIKLERCEFGCF